MTVHKRLFWLAGKLFDGCKGTLFLASKLHWGKSFKNKILNVVVSQSKPCLNVFCSVTEKQIEKYLRVKKKITYILVVAFREGEG